MLLLALLFCDPVDEIIRRRMRPDPGTPVAFPGPRKLAFLAIELPFHDPRRRKKPYQIGHEELSRELRILDSRRAAFRTSDGLPQQSLRLVPFMQQLYRPFVVRRPHLQPVFHDPFRCKPQPFQRRFMMDPGRNVRFSQAPLQYFSCRKCVKRCNCYSIHDSKYASPLQNQPPRNPRQARSHYLGAREPMRLPKSAEILCEMEIGR
jgi:hypothetical protein